MTSSQPVVTPNALNFTPDNKRCYAYSGAVVIDNDPDVAMLQFKTNSEYIVAQISFGTRDTNLSPNVHIGYEINFNSKVVFTTFSLSDGDGTLIFDGASFPQTILIPPFTEVQIDAFTSDANNNNVFMMLTGEAFGMTDTGFQ